MFLTPHGVMGWLEIVLEDRGMILNICFVYLILISVYFMNLGPNLYLTIYEILCMFHDYFCQVIHRVYENSHLFVCSIQVIHKFGRLGVKEAQR